MVEPRVRHLSFTLSMDNSLHCQLWDKICSIPKGKRTEFLCKTLTQRQREEELSEIVYKNTLRALKEYGGAIPQQNTMPAEINDDADQAGEFERNFFGFLAELQAQGEDDD